MSDPAGPRTRTIRWEDPLATAARGREMGGLKLYATGTTSCLLIDVPA